MKKLIFCGLLLSVFFFISCAKSRNTDLLERVERYMELYPDSALKLLMQIPHPESLLEKQRAEYALLLTQARDKNFLDSLQSDSLIKQAVDYYRKSNNKVKTGKALFYYGKIMAIQGKDSIAARAYFEAQTELENTKEYKTQAFIQEYIGYLNKDRKEYDDAINNFRKSAYYYYKMEDTLGAIYDYRNIAWIYYNKQNSDSAIWYAKVGISLLKGDSLSPVLPSLLQLLGEQAGKNGNHSKAISYFQRAIKYEHIPNVAYYYYMSLGDSYMQIKQFEKAKECFERILESQNPYTLSGAYSYLYLLEKKRYNYERAICYKEKSDSLLQLSQDEKLRSKLSSIQRQHETNRLQIEKEKLQLRKNRQLYLGVLLFISMIGIGGISYQKIRKHYRKIYKKHFEKTLQTISDNEQIIEQFLCQIKELEQKETTSTKAAREQLEKTEQKVQFLVDENKKLKEKLNIDGIAISKQLREHLLIASNLTPTEKRLLFEYVDFAFGNFATQMREEYGMKDGSLLFVILIKLGFSTEDLNFIFESEQSAVWKRKQRLKEKLGLESKVNLDSFLLYYPSKSPVKTK